MKVSCSGFKQGIKKKSAPVSPRDQQQRVTLKCVNLFSLKEKH